MTAPADITAILREANLDFSQHEPDDDFWIVTFEVEGRQRDVVLQYPEAGEYLVALGYIVAPFQGRPIETMDAGDLARMIQLATEVPLAKLHYLDRRYFVISECAVDGVNGRKLRRRLEACARLADRISVAFSS